MNYIGHNLSVAAGLTVRDDFLEHLVFFEPYKTIGTRIFLTREDLTLGVWCDRKGYGLHDAGSTLVFAPESWDREYAHTWEGITDALDNYDDSHDLIVKHCDALEEGKILGWRVPGFRILEPWELLWEEFVNEYDDCDDVGDDCDCDACGESKEYPHGTK